MPAVVTSKADFQLKSITKLFVQLRISESTSQMNNKELPNHDIFHNQVRICKPLENEYLYYEKLIGSASAIEFAPAKMRLSEKPPSRAENFS